MKLVYDKATTALKKKKLSFWLHANKLLANATESSCVILAPKDTNFTSNNSLVMINTPLERVTSKTFLGVHLDTQLS